jgi:hypothetical protein
MLRYWFKAYESVMEMVREAVRGLVESMRVQEVREILDICA